MRSVEEFNGSTALALLYTYTRSLKRSQSVPEESVTASLLDVANRSVEGSEWGVVLTVDTTETTWCMCCAATTRSTSIPATPSRRSLKRWGWLGLMMHSYVVTVNR